MSTLSAQNNVRCRTHIRSLDRPDPPWKTVNIKGARDTFGKLAEQHYHYCCTLPQLGYAGCSRGNEKACWGLSGLEIRR